MTTSNTPAQIRALKKAFLQAYAQTGTVTAAAKLVEISRDTHYGWLDRDKKGKYRQAFEKAQQEFCDRLVHEAVRRAVSGWDEPVFYQGKLCIHPETKAPVGIRKYSDRMLELLLKAKIPEFREKYEHTGKDGGPIRFEGKIPETLRVVFVKPGETKQDEPQS